MIAVIFEVIPAPTASRTYLDIAAELARAEKVDGFLSIERFQSLTEPRKIFWLFLLRRDEEAVKHWRTDADHRHAQKAGRAGISRRLPAAGRRGAPRLYGMYDRAEVPARFQGIEAQSPAR